MKRLITLIFLASTTLFSYGQIRIIKVVPSTNTITVKNFGSGNVDISSYRLCSLFDYTTNLTTGITINSGSMSLNGGEEVEFVAPGGASGDWDNLEANADLGLYISSNFGSTSDMVDFTQWGSGGNGRESVAVNKGIWTAGEFASGDEPYTYTGDGTENGAAFWQGVATNASPTDISLSNSSIGENAASGTTVGTLSTTDADVSDTHTYSFVSGSGDEDNASFSINGSTLESAEVFNFETQSSHNVRIETNDGNGGTFSKSFTITIINVGESPTDILLSNQAFPENEPIGSAVGTLSTVDDDNGETYTYLLVSGTGDEDNASFQISNDQLLTNEVFDLETKSSYNIRILTDDGIENTFSKAFVITITEENDPPTDIQLSNTSIDENENAGTAIGSLTSTDADAANTHTYTLVAGEGDEDNASFSISGSDLIAELSFDFESQNSYNVRIQTQDNIGATFAKAFTVSVGDVNEAPTVIELSANTVCIGDAAGFEVGTLSTTDEDTDDSFTYSLAAGTGSDDNDLFTVSGDKLVVDADITASLSSPLSILVQSSDQGGLVVQQQFDIIVEGEPLGLGNPNSVQVYPNPFTDHLTISLSETVQQAVIRVYDLSGSELVSAKGPISNQAIRLERLNLPKGVYILEVAVDNQMERSFIIRE